MSEKKSLLVFDQRGYAEPYNNIYDVVFVKTPEELGEVFPTIDTVLFTGGSDISPHLYGEEKHVNTSCNRSRDRFEVMMIDRAVNAGKNILGICRGAQLACIKAGGKLIQHVTGHSSTHTIEDVFGNTLPMPSLHHQMMRPELAEQSVVVAKMQTPVSSVYEDGERTDLYKPFSYVEPEIVFFPKIKALAIQGHPEMVYNKTLHQYCCDLIRFYLFKEANLTPHYGEEK